MAFNMANKKNLTVATDKFRSLAKRLLRTRFRWKRESPLVATRCIAYDSNQKFAPCLGQLGAKRLVQC